MKNNQKISERMAGTNRRFSAVYVFIESTLDPLYNLIFFFFSNTKQNQLAKSD